MKKRPTRFSKAEIMRDPELRESVGYYLLAHEIDDNYGMLRRRGLSHEVATIKSRQMAGLKVEDDAPIAAENAADAALAKRYRLEQENKELQAKVGDKQKRMAGIVLAALAGGAGTNEIIEYLQGPTIEEMENYRNERSL